MFNTPFRHAGQRVPGVGPEIAQSHCLRYRRRLSFDARSGREGEIGVKLILLTHAHTDHIADLARLKKKPARLFIFQRESIPGAETISEGQEFNVGNLKVKALLTWGHSRGGMTFFVTGLARPVAIVERFDFAGSMGGGNVS